MYIVSTSPHQRNYKRNPNESSNAHANYAAVIIIADMNSFYVFVSRSFNFVGGIRQLLQLLELLCSLSLCK